MDVIGDLLERYPVLQSQEKELRKAGALLCCAAKAGGKVLTCGNGGSAADAEHVVGELMKDFRRKRPISQSFRERLAACDEAPEDLIHSLQEVVPAICLNSQTALLTALLNDGDPAMIFAQQVYGYGKKGDVLLAFSTSGNSKNVLHAARVARAKEMTVILISGTGGGKIGLLSDVAICVPETETYKVQELTLPIYHALCILLEEELFHC
jgi:D-sedoheptulose 7-phosphate isomerase